MRKISFGDARRRNRSNSFRGFEQLESRRQLAADLWINSFSANGTDLTVDYQVAYETAVDFDISIYRSSDGVTLDELLTSKRVDFDLDVGNFQTTIYADFSDVEGDYQLIAVIDAAGENTETDESNNLATFGGGVFFDHDYVLHVQGASGEDVVAIEQDEFLYVNLNGNTTTYLPTEIAAIHFRLQDSDDSLEITTAITPSVIAYGGAGSDSLQGGSGNDVFFGGLGDDTLLGGAGDDELYGEDGYDTLDGDEGDDSLDGGKGLDVISGGDGADTLWAGDDETEYYGYGDVLYAGEGDDTIYGSESDDVIYGGDGNDTIYGLGGNDQLYGEAGDDTIYGGDDDDYLYGGADSDTLVGQAGDDSLFGEVGGDVLQGGSGDDYLNGGIGSDTFNGGGQAGDTVGDRPSIDNFSWNYDSTNHSLTISGNITDDESVTGLNIRVEGQFSATSSLDSSGNFEHQFIVVNPTSDRIYILFTDAEGLEADPIDFCIT